jgi:hypothetical protein
MLTGLTIALAVATFVPGAAALAGPAALIALGGAGASFAYLGLMAATLATCLAEAATTPPVWLALSAGVAFVTAVVAVVTVVYGIVITIQTAAAAASG